MIHPGGSALSLRQLGTALRRHKRKVAVFFVAVMGLAVAVTVLMPPVYRARAKLLIRLGRENAALDPTATFGQAPVVAVPASRENDINSAVEILTSRFLIEQVVDSVGPQVLLGRGEPIPPTQARNIPEPDPPGVVTDRTRAIDRFARKLDVEVVKKSNVLAIRYDGPSPDVSQAALSRLIDCYLERYAHLHRTPGVQQFLAEQVARLRKQLTQAEEALRDRKTQTGLFFPEGQRQSLVARVGAIEDDLLRTAAAAAAAEAEIKSLQSQLAKLSPTGVTATTRGFPNPVADMLHQQIFTLQQKELDLLSRYPEEHPEVRLVRRQLAAAGEAAGREEKNREQVTVGPSKTYEEAGAALLRQEALLASLQARTEELRRQRDRERAALETLDRDELTVARLQREVDVQAAHYRKYAENLEQAAIDRALETERLSNISIVQPATADAEPVRPQPLLYLGVALLAALAGSIALALYSESHDGPRAPAGGGRPATEAGAGPEKNGSCMPLAAEGPGSRG